ncbi:PEP-CTERM sorting domain-containing protein [Roseisolibacter sp. H3M3-2]|uniref:PEP-CTERM sorting domain-containing protein n=1 Tax=Roseisolibacter sp. H3M3-2 TaxID=3031323 RepID=UPI0023DA457A|nr:PEP-CTERM sorting domain-containing protein [Roseisolibacter sp. H3M3-2]MDF1501633.1 PEP-CTERM sorting domain-containing protein [Roseisolibacter sp. H3M3-2]
MPVPSPRALGAAVLLACAAAAGAARPAAAQVAVAYYAGTPDPAAFSTLTGADFSGLTPACARTVSAIDFPSASSLAAICGPGAGVDGFSESARFLGALVAPAVGVYQLRVFNDDGFALFVNGTLAINRFHDDWQPDGLFHAVALQAGVNPFQLDYYANAASFSFLRVELPAGVSYATATSTVPEPSTVALLGGGLAVLGAAARRRRASLRA